MNSMKIAPILYLVAVMALSCTFRANSRDNMSCITNDSLQKLEVRQKAMEKNNYAICMKMNIDNLDTLNKAARLLGEAIAIDSSYILAYGNLAQLQTAMGQVEEAIYTLKLAHRRDPNYKGIPFVIGEYYDLLSEGDSAQKYYNKSLDIYNRAIKAYPDSILLQTDKHFILSIMKNDGTIFTEFAKQDPNCLKVDTRPFDKEKYLNNFVLPAYLNNLQNQIKKRHEKNYN